MDTSSHNPEDIMPESGGEDNDRNRVFESLKYPVCVIGTDGILTYGNSAFYQFFGSGDQHHRLNWQHPLFSSYRKRIAQAYLSVLNGSDNRCFAVIDSAEGKEIPVEIYLFPMYSGSEISSILAMMHVVDNRILSFDRSTLSYISEENFQYDNQHFQFSPLPILRIDRSMNIVKCSSSIEGFLGYTNEELVERKTATLKTIFLYDSDRVKNTINEIFEGSRPFHRKGEIKIAAKDSQEKVANLTIYPIIQNNEIAAVEIVIENITELKFLKDKINSINRIQLLQDITKGFLHSLNNSINIIMSQTQLLLQITEKETVLDGIHLIEKSALDIVDNIRRVQNSIAQKSYFYEERTEPLVNIIEDAIEFSRMQFKVEGKEKRRNITIEKKYFTAVNIKIDTGLLREIIISIILKVSDFIQKKGTIEITLKENSDLVLSVRVLKDDRHIEALQLPKMVNVFSGIDIRQAAEKISLKIIEEESSETYSLKIIFPHRLVIDNLKKPAPGHEVKLRDLDIIIVEDEKALKKILFEIFDRMGNRVFICENGLEALDEFKKKHYDLVITDYGIPGITGLELVVRAKELREDVTTILLSGWTLEDLTAYKNVVDLFMPKPFKLDDLINNISQVLKDKKTPPEQA